MTRPNRSTIIWSLSFATVTVVGAVAGVFVCRAKEQQRTIAAVEAIEMLGYACVLPAEGATYGTSPGGAGVIRGVVVSPIEFIPRGPEWLRSWIGTERCRVWLDQPIAVNVAGSEANDVDLPHLASFPCLKRLDLNGTHVSDSGLVVLRRLPALEELSLGSQRITDAGLDHLQGLTHLRALILYGTITDAGLLKLGRLPDLRELQVASPAITDSGLQELARIETLEKLSLSSASVTDAGVAKLSRLPRLTQLYLGEIPAISEACLDGLRREHPALAITYEPYGPAP